MRATKLIAMILVVLTVAYCGIALFIYDVSSSVEILCTAGSEAENWAKHHGAAYRLIGESERASCELHLGTFDYILENGGAVITGCHSTRSEIVIPREIDGYQVVGVDVSAFNGARTVEAVYVPETVTAFEPLHTQQYVIHCYNDSDTYKQLQKALEEKAAAERLKAAADAAPSLTAKAEAEAQRCLEEADAAKVEALAAQMKADSVKKLAEEPGASDEVITQAAELVVEAEKLAGIAEEKHILADEAVETAAEKKEEASSLAKQLAEISPLAFVVSTFRVLQNSEDINFYAADIPFTYNDSANGLELISYTGRSAQIVVPETINGTAVTVISFPVEENIQSVLIPASVTDIRAPLAEPRYDDVFFFNLALVLLGLIVGLAATVVAGKRYKTAEQRFLGVSLVYSGVKYYVLLLLWSAVSLFFGLEIWLQLLVGIVLLAAAPIELTLAASAGQKVEKINNSVGNQIAFIRAYRAKSDHLQNCAAAAVKPYCKEVAEAFRYADPVSHDDLAAVEQRITAEFEAFSSAVLAGDEAAAAELARKVHSLVEERNKACILLK